MKKRSDGPKGYVEEPDPYRTRSRDGKTILCHTCGLAASFVKKLRIISCDACDHHFHLECLDPPLVTPPLSSKWVCPLHVDRTVPSHQVSKESNLIPIDTLHTPNNGDIDVVLAPQDQTKARQIEDISINRVRYQVPENIIILDFWAKLAKSNQTASGPQPLNNSIQGSSLSLTPVSSKVIDLAPVPARRGLLPSASTNQNARSHCTPFKESDPPPRPISTQVILADLSSQSSSTSPPLPAPSLPLQTLPPPASTSTSTPDLSYLLQAAQLASEPPKSHPTAGLTLLGNAASLQPQAALNSSTQKIIKPSPKSLGTAQRTRTRGSNRLAKSSPLHAKVLEPKTSLKSSTSTDQPQSDFNQRLTTESTITRNSETTTIPPEPPSASSSQKLPPPRKSDTFLAQTRKRNRANSSVRKTSSVTPLHQASNKSHSDLQSMTNAVPHSSFTGQSSAATTHVNPPLQTSQLPRLSSETQASDRSSTLPHTTSVDFSTDGYSPRTSLPIQECSHANLSGLVPQGGLDSSLSTQPVMRSTTSTPNGPSSSSGPPLASTSRKTSKSQIRRPSPLKTLSKGQDCSPEPPPSYSSRTLSHQATTPSLFENGTTPASQLKPPAAESSQSATSGSYLSVQVQPSLAQPSQSALTKATSSTTCPSHISPALKNQNIAPNETGHISRPKKKARRNNYPPSSQITSSNLTGESSAHAADSHSTSNSPHVLMANDKIMERPNPKPKHPLVKQKGSTRSTNQHTSKSAKPVVNNPSISSSTTPVGFSNSSISLRQSDVPPPESRPMIPVPRIVTSLPPISAKELASNKMPMVGQISDNCLEKATPLLKPVTVNTQLQMSQPSVKSSQGTRNLTSTSSLPTKTKRKKLVKDSKSNPNIASHEPKRSGHTMAPCSASEPVTSVSSEKVSEFTFSVDPRLTARTASPVMFQSKSLPKHNASLGSPRTLAPKVADTSIGLNTSQSKQPGSKASPKPPPRKKARQKVAAEPSSNSNASNIVTSVALGSSSIGHSIRPVTSQSSHTILEPTLTSFVPHPQNPMTLVQHQRQQLPLTGGHAQFAAPSVLKPGSSSSDLNKGRAAIGNENPSCQLDPCRDSLTVHGSSPPGLRTTAITPAPTISSTNDSKFAVSVSRPPTIGNSPIEHNNVFIPLPLTQPVRATPEPNWK